MTRMGVAGVVLLVGTLGALRASALKNCNAYLEVLDLEPKTVTIDGALATEQAGWIFVTDGGIAVEARPTIVGVSPPEALARRPLCDNVDSPALVLEVEDPFTGALETLTFEAEP